jgi:hypothetical protein
MCLENNLSGLPENAYRELQDGEEYKPVLPPGKNIKEVTPWSVTWGLDMHGKYPFPEATATTQVLISGENCFDCLFDLGQYEGEERRKLIIFAVGYL